MAFLVGGANSASGGYEIGNSGVFNDGQSQALTRTHGASGSTRTFTFSCWVKFSDPKTGSSAATCCHGLFSSEEEANHQFFISTDEGQILRIADYQDGSYNLHLQTNRKFRDHSAWYHFCIIFDTTDGTEGDRCKVYVNGVRETSFSTAVYPSQNTDLYGNDNQAHFIGRRGGSNTQYFDGYMADVNFIDGTAAAHTEFGEVDEDSGIWKPKKYEGSYGNNGFFLEFGNTGTGQGTGRFATDTSGVGNHYDTNNFSGIYQKIDTPTNNFCTLNPLHKSTDDVKTSKGNLEVILDQTSGWQHCAATIAVKKGKWYWEAKAETVSATDKSSIGVFQFNTTDVDFINVANTDRSSKGISGHGAGTGSYAYADDDDIMCAMDLDNNKVYWGKNGTWFGDLDPAAGSGSTTQTISNTNFCVPAVGGYGASNWQLNFGDAPYSISSGNSDDAGIGNFEYDVPTGFYALCTKNLAEFG